MFLGDLAVAVGTKTRSCHDALFFFCWLSKFTINPIQAVLCLQLIQ